ncbi:MAG TPA: methyl-accepting chemotaxis protein [Anaeromyxobacteraceae bacterium]|nr:methyl-accepting chemotaxis protein [Anaeromyxobacteraceae bacterium]
MRLFPRLARNIAISFLLAPLLAWVALTQFFPLSDSQLAFLGVAIPLGYLGGVALKLAVAFRLTRPVQAALGDGGNLATAAAGVRAAKALPARFAGTSFGVAAMCAGAVIASALQKGVRQDLAAPLACLGLAVALLEAMMGYAVTAETAATVVRELGAGLEDGARTTVRAKILAFGLGLLTFTALLFAASAFARHRGEQERAALRDVWGAQDTAASLAPSQGGAASAPELVWRLTGAPTALVGADGSFLVGFGDGADSLRPGADAIEKQRGGWTLTRRLGGGTALVTYLAEERVETDAGSYWRALLTLGLATYAVAAVLVWITARAFTFPLQLLRRAADRMASGDLTASPPILSGDEVGHLASDFRRMAQGLSGLVGEVQEASRGVDDACRELADIGARIRSGAADQHAGMEVVESAVAAMQDSIVAVERALSGLGDYARSTRSAVAEMARGLEGARGQGIELEKAMAAALAEVEGLAGAGQRAREALSGLDALAARLGDSLARVDASLSGLELAAVASQLNAAQAKELSDEAGEVVAETVRGIEALRAAVGDAQQRVTSLGRRAGDIDQIVDFIAEVAGRTNLLSLNASIIAAQAGEHGKAFAVVADQIRDLASQISSSTKSIGDIIRSVREDVDGTATLIAKGDELAGAGVGLARRSAEALLQIRSVTVQGHGNAARIQEAVQGHVDSARAVARLVGSVGEGSRAVADAVERIGGSVAALDRAARGVGSLADRVRRALEEEAALGQRQMQSLESFAGMLGEVDRAAGGHGEATGRVRESLRALGAAAAQHEVAMAELAAVAARLEGRTRALSDSVGRFKTA